MTKPISFSGVRSAGFSIRYNGVRNRDQLTLHSALVFLLTILLHMFIAVISSSSFPRFKSHAYCPSCTRERLTEGNPCPHAFEVALAQAANSKWYVSTLELQLVSFQICVTCRGVRTVRINVSSETPPRLWGDDGAIKHHRNVKEKRKIPCLQASGVNWMMSANLLQPVLLQSPLLKGVTWMKVVNGRKSLDEEFWTDDYEDGQPDTIYRPHTVSGLMSSPEHYLGSMRSYAQVWCANVDRVQTLVRHFSGPAVDEELKHWSGALNFGGGGMSLRTLQELVAHHAICNQNERISLPANLIRLTFGTGFNQPITGIAWPTSLVELTFGCDFNQPIAHVTWPVSLLKLAFWGRFNQSLDNVVLPPSLLKLAFGRSFNQPIISVVWPASLLEVAFWGNYDHPIARLVWPASLRRLSFGAGFNRPIQDVVWPVGLHDMTFQGRFNQAITGGLLPGSLRKLTLGPVFNQPVTGVIWPESLESLAFGMSFNQSVEGVAWPTSLHVLSLGSKFNQSLDNVIWPPCLEHLTFGDYIDQQAEQPQPDLGRNYKPRPIYRSGSEAMPQIKWGLSFNQPIGGRAWPASLRQLKFGGDFNQPMDANVLLPDGLEHLGLGGLFNHAIDDAVWPASLVSISLSNTFDQPVHGVLWPASLRHPWFGSAFNQPITGVVWPPDLRSLEFLGEFNMPVLGVAWPSRLQVLRFGGSFNQTLDAVVLPGSLVVLELDKTFFESLGEIVWPTTLVVERSVRLSRRRRLGYNDMLLGSDEVP